jgi:hypothetical protein
MELNRMYFELRYTHRITDYYGIDNYLQQDSGYSNQRYKTIDQFYAESLGVTRSGLNDLQASWSEFHNFYSRYKQQREELFRDFKVVNWIRSQGCRCGYCGISQRALRELVELRGGNLTLNKGTKRSKGTLEIEKKDPSKGYTTENSILSCPLCNNAKSNLISEHDWRLFFAPVMKEYYKSVLNNVNQY